MSVAELLPSIQALPRIEKLELIRILATELALEEPDQESRPIELLPEDQCPYTPAELARMRSQSGGRTLAEIRRSRGIL